MENKGKKVIVAMSGGVDSSVSVALLKKSGYEVIGVFMKCWDDPDEKFGCTAEEDEREARRAAAHLDIPIYTFDFVQEYRERVIDYFVREYAQGRTPNPDIMCNKEIKFGIFFDKAIEDMEADFVATGHYARITPAITPRSPAPTRLRPGHPRPARSFARGIADLQLLKGKDHNKDQSYFLYRLEQKHLAKTLFPIGEYAKDEVRKMARAFGLPNAERADSQGICFMGKISVQDFLEQYIPSKPGPIVKSDGAEIGTHEGLHRYTIGQRRGINVGGGIPHYVAAKDYKTNTLHVAYEYDDSLLSDKAEMGDVHWISGMPKLPRDLRVKIRYRQPDQGARVMHNDTYAIQFAKPQRAITPGQSAVLYDGDRCLGGGVII